MLNALNIYSSSTLSASKINKGLIIEEMYTRYSKQLRFTLGAKSYFRIQLLTTLGASSMKSEIAF